MDLEDKKIILEEEISCMNNDLYKLRCVKENVVRSLRGKIDNTKDYRLNMEYMFSLSKSISLLSDRISMCKVSLGCTRKALKEESV